jgi:isopentenyl-diphosphate delta-isomerase
MEEEMGFITEVRKVFDFVYKAEVGQGLIEHEFDHVLIGFYENPPVLNPEEAMEWKWMSMGDIEKEMEASPERFTVWFRIAFPRVKAFVDEKMNFDTA